MASFPYATMLMPICIFDVEAARLNGEFSKCPRLRQTGLVKDRLVPRDVQKRLYGGVASAKRHSFQSRDRNDFTVHANGHRRGAPLPDGRSALKTNPARRRPERAIDHHPRQLQGDWLSAQGRGSVQLRDGLIWEIPVSAFSRRCSTPDAGPGSSRAAKAPPTFLHHQRRHLLRRPANQNRRSCGCGTGDASI